MDPSLTKVGENTSLLVVFSLLRSISNLSSGNRKMADGTFLGKPSKKKGIKMNGNFHCLDPLPPPLESM